MNTWFEDKYYKFDCEFKKENEFVMIVQNKLTRRKYGTKLIPSSSEFRTNHIFMQNPKALFQCVCSIFSGNDNHLTAGYTLNGEIFELTIHMFTDHLGDDEITIRMYPMIVSFDDKDMYHTIYMCKSI